MAGKSKTLAIKLLSELFGLFVDLLVGLTLTFLCRHSWNWILLRHNKKPSKYIEKVGIEKGMAYLLKFNICEQSLCAVRSCCEETCDLHRIKDEMRKY